MTRKIGWFALSFFIGSHWLSADAFAKQLKSDSSPIVLQDAERGKLYTVVQVKFETKVQRESFQEANSDFAKSGAFFYSTFDCFADMFVEPLRVDEIEKKIKSVGGWPESLGNFRVPPQRPIIGVGKPRSDPEKIFRGDTVSNLTGKDVIVAIVDTGVDFRHDDFITTGPDGKKKSRILFLWDTTRQAPKNGPGSSVFAKTVFPTGEPIGTIYTRDELTAELAKDRDVPRLWKIPQSDTNGHGTACAGISAGNGRRNLEMRGIAPEADIIAVRLGANDDLRHGFLLNQICGWIDEVAKAHNNVPAVISCSFGGHYTGHDGQSVEELQLNARFPLSTRRRAICVAAGNEGIDLMHAEVRLTGDERRSTLKWTAKEGSGIKIFSNCRAPEDYRVTESAKFRISKHEVNLVTKLVQTGIVVFGNGELEIVRTGDAEVLADVYFSSKGAGEFVGKTSIFSKLIGNPASSTHVITVGSYDWNDQFPFSKEDTIPLLVRERGPDGIQEAAMKIGTLSNYSSPGPLRRARLGDPPKPDIVAPGQYYAAAASQIIFGEAEYQRKRTKDEQYVDFNGTSAATPYVAGVVALMFEAKPDLTLGEIKAALADCATRQFEDYRKRPDSWGNGKLDYHAAQRLLDRVKPERSRN